MIDETRAALFRDLFGATTGWAKSRALKALIEAYPRPLTADEIAIIIYPSWSPADPVKTVRVLLSGVRRNIKPLGWTISTNRYGRFPVGEYPTPHYGLVRLP